MGDWYGDFLRNLRSLVGGGVPLLEALETLARGKKERGARLAEELREGVRRGLSLAEALSTSTAQIPREDIALVEAGERSGTLEEMLGRLGREIDRRREARRALRFRAAYPALLLAAAVVLLPLPLVVQGGVGAYLKVLSAVLLPAGILVLVAWKCRALAPPGSPARRRWESFCFRLPWLGTLLLEKATGRACLLLGRLLEAGLPFAEALPLAGGAQGWDILKAEFAEVQERLREKRSVAEAMLALRLFRLQRQLPASIAAAEASGTLDRSFQELGLALEERYARQVEMAAGALPYVGLLAAGAVILAWALRVFSSIYGRP